MNKLYNEKQNYLNTQPTDLKPEQDHKQHL